MPRWSLAASNGCVSSPVYLWHYACEPLDIFNHFFWPNVSWCCCDLILRQSALNPRVSFWWILAEQRKSCHTDPRFRQRLIAIHVPTIIDGRLLRYIKACVCFSLNINEIQRYRKNRPSEHRVSSFEQHDSDKQCLP